MLRSKEEKIAETMFLVEADSFSTMMLWKKHHEIVTWEQDSSGFFQEIGQIAKRPICVSITWEIINGCRVAFYEGTSQLVDHVMIEKWLDKTFKYRPRCDAGHFHRCLQAIEEISKRKDNETKNV